jgi:hypothetical protein
VVSVRSIGEACKNDYKASACGKSSVTPKETQPS